MNQELYKHLKIKSVAYSFQGSHTAQLDFWNWQADGIMWLALRSVKSNNVDFLNQICYFSIKNYITITKFVVPRFSISRSCNHVCNVAHYLLTLYLPSPTWKTRNFCRQVHSITRRFTSSWILSASVAGFLSSQSGLSAAMNSFQSMRPSPDRSNRSATAFISSLLVSNSVKQSYIS